MLNKLRTWDINKEAAPAPSPIPMRECACGCGYSFQPNRRDKIYINNTHANYGYNHGKRKLKNKKKNEINKRLAANDKITEKYFNAYPKTETVVAAPLFNLKTDGFDTSLFISSSVHNNETWYFLYNYAFTIYTKDNQTLVKIFKLKKNE